MSFNNQNKAQERGEAPTPAAPVATAVAAAPLSVAAAVPDIESTKSTSFDSKEYSALCSRYLSPRIRENEELPDGTILRRRIGQTIIDQAPYAKLKQRIADLKRCDNDKEIYRLLCELRHWEIHGGRVPDSMDQSVGSSEVVEFVDIAATENVAVIDVEAFIENLLAEEGESDLTTNTPVPDNGPDHLQPLPDQVPSVTSVVRMAMEPQQAVPVAGGNYETEATEGKEHEVVDLLCSSDDDNDGNITNNSKFWTKEDDDTLCNAVASLTEDSCSDKNIDWASISSQVGTGRSALQCWERYNKLRKNTYKTRARKCRVLMSLPDLPTPAPSLPTDTTDDFINVVGTPNSPADSYISSDTYMSSEEIIKTNVASGLGNDDQASLKRAWNKQSNLRTKGKWKPSGGWKAPAWATQQSAINLNMKGGLDTAADALTKKKNNKSTPKRRKISTHASCSKQVLCRSLSLLAESIPEDMTVPSEVASLSQLKCIGYAKKITEDLLFRAYRAQQGLLPATDCDEWEVVKMARSYYDYWRPAKGNVKAILLAESHSKTERDQMMSTRLDPSLCPQYPGPRNYIKLVHCLAYGELKCIASQEGKGTKKRATSSTCSSSIAQQNDSGTSQFWTLLAAASRGTGHVPSNVRGGNRNRGKHVFATDVLKMGGLSIEDRLEAKLSILQKLKDRGIWLIDVSVIGWYISQPQKYRRSTATNEIHRMAKERPPKELKPASMVLSWELLTKHIIRKAAEEGGLNILVLIGKELENILSMERIAEAVTFGSIAAGSSSAHRCNIESIPAPNAWSEFFVLELLSVIYEFVHVELFCCFVLYFSQFAFSLSFIYLCFPISQRSTVPGGYWPWYENVASLMDEYAPDSSSI